MNRFQILLAAAAALIALPAFAADGVAIVDAYARSSGPSGAIFMQIDNQTDADDRLIAARSDIAAKVELHTHIAGADGVMQMVEVNEGFVIPAKGSHALARGGDHIMLMGLHQPMKDGDLVLVTLTFETAGEVVIEVPVDSARKPGAMGGMGTMNHGAMGQGASAPAN